MGRRKNIEKTIEILPVYRFLLEKKARYKVSYGGRAAGRSWNFVRAMLVRMLEKPTQICCFRQIQTTINDSIYRLFCNQIKLLGLQDYFLIKEESIVGYNGSSVIFKGLYRNQKEIRSLEGIDIADVEEADSVTEESWDYLIPTIRKEGSEIWVKFNTGYEDDYTYQFFVSNPPPNSIVVKTTYKDNKYFSKTLQEEMEKDFRLHPEKARNIWLGEPIGTGDKVFPQFSEKNIKYIPLSNIKHNAKFYMAMDPALHYYPACLWMAVFPINERKKYPDDYVKYVYNEYPRYEDFNMFFSKVRKEIYFTKTLKELSDIIRRNDGLDVKIEKRGIDTRFTKGCGVNYYFNDTISLVENFKKSQNGSLYFSMPNPRYLDIVKTNIIEDLALQRLIINPECRNLINSLHNHRFISGSEKESEKNKDFIDALRILYATIEDRGISPDSYYFTYNFNRNEGIIKKEVAWMV